MAGNDSPEQALAGGAPQRVGWFRFYFTDERWAWSDQVQLMHGYQPGTVTPTTELVLSQETNVKLRKLAERFLADFTGQSYDETLPPRATFDHLLLRAHHRISAAGA